jgi:hypothetical protein
MFYLDEYNSKQYFFKLIKNMNIFLLLKYLFKTITN